MKGIVKWFNRKKGYGFIQGEDGEEYFVHFTAVPRGVFLRENDEVSFEPADTERGKQARDVQLERKASDIESESEGQEEELSEEPEEKKEEEGSVEDSENFGE